MSDATRREAEVILAYFEHAAEGAGHLCGHQVWRKGSTGLWHWPGLNPKSSQQMAFSTCPDLTDDLLDILNERTSDE